MQEHLTHERVPEAVSEPQDAPLLSCHHRHALFSAAERAYNRHLALRLRPDDVWLTIAQGVAEHINAPGNAEAFRSKFVAHEGKKELVVKQASPAAAWCSLTGVAESRPVVVVVGSVICAGARLTRGPWF